jgi:histidinol phosphatase-like enzyme
MACECKKPKPGMLIDAARKWNIDLAASYMIGDTISDTEAAAAAGCKTIVLDWPYNKDLKSDFRIKSLLDILAIIK